MFSTQVPHHLQSQITNSQKPRVFFTALEGLAGTVVITNQQAKVATLLTFCSSNLLVQRDQ